MTPKEEEDSMKEIPSYLNYYACTDGKIFSNKTKKYLKTTVDKQGYLKVGLYNNKSNKNIKVHRLIALTYLDNPNLLRDINHKNGIKSDNRVENLEWCTHSYNMKHAFDTGLKEISEKHKLLFSKRSSK